MMEELKEIIEILKMCCHFCHIEEDCKLVKGGAICFDVYRIEQELRRFITQNYISREEVERIVDGFSYYLNGSFENERVDISKSELKQALGVSGVKKGK